MARLAWIGVSAAFAVGVSLGLNCGGSGTSSNPDGGGAGARGGTGGAGGGTGGTAAAGGRGGTTGAGGVGAGGAGTGGTAGAGAGGAGTGGTAGTGAGDAGTGGIAGGAGGAGGAVSFGCSVANAQCSDGRDNDGDMKVDSLDPECVGPCDNDEGSFATGIPGDNMDACKQDCFFDGNSGMGDDGCDWNLKCDPASPGANAAKPCPYDMRTAMNPQQCKAQQSQQCITTCRRITPNGCDCFGCCLVPTPSGPRSVLLVPTCKESTFTDTTACPSCTQQTSCLNTCGMCEVCVGKPAPDPGCVVPPPGTGGMGGASGTGGAGGMGGDPGTGGAGGMGGDPGTGGAGGVAGGCAPDAVYCGPGGVLRCPSGQYCITGCCLIP